MGWGWGYCHSCWWCCLVRYDSMRTSCRTVPIIDVIRRPPSSFNSNELSCKIYPISLRGSRVIQNGVRIGMLSFLLWWLCLYDTKPHETTCCTESIATLMRRPHSPPPSDAFSCKERPIPWSRSRVIQNGMRIGILPFCFFFLPLLDTTFETARYNVTCRSYYRNDVPTAFAVLF